MSIESQFSRIFDMNHLEPIPNKKIFLGADCIIFDQVPELVRVIDFFVVVQKCSVLIFMV